MEREILVFMDRAGETVSVGTLWARTRGARQTASFEYDTSWLARRTPSVSIPCCLRHETRMRRYRRLHRVEVGGARP